MQSNIYPALLHTTGQRGEQSVADALHTPIAVFLSHSVSWQHSPTQHLHHMVTSRSLQQNLRRSPKHDGACLSVVLTQYSLSMGVSFHPGLSESRGFAIPDPSAPWPTLYTVTLDILSRNGCAS